MRNPPDEAILSNILHRSQVMTREILAIKQYLPRIFSRPAGRKAPAKKLWVRLKRKTEHVFPADEPPKPKDLVNLPAGVTIEVESGRYVEWRMRTWREIAMIKQSLTANLLCPPTGCLGKERKILVRFLGTFGTFGFRLTRIQHWHCSSAFASSWNADALPGQLDTLTGVRNCLVSKLVSVRIASKNE